MSKSVLFVCFGNKCRSTMAEAIFLDLIKKKGVADEWQVDSAAHGDWHIGEPCEPRTISVLEHHGISGYSHTARMITLKDFFDYDYILGMDNYNLRNLQALKPERSHCKIQLLGQYDPKGVRVIFDPYFSDSISAYEDVYRQCSRACQFFFEKASKSQSQKTDYAFGQPTV